MNFTKSKPYIIAEMSANHCGNKNIALKLIKAAKDCGADAVKIQTYTADTLTINCNDKIFMNPDDGLWKGQSLYELYKKAYTPWEWHKDLKAYADELEIDFFSTPFDYSAVDFLESQNTPIYKIASFEAIDYPLIKYAAKFKKPMIISSGISTLEEIYEAIDACKSVGNNDITILKCTSSYPAKLNDLNLITIKDMIEKLNPLGVKVGLSDHCMSLEAPIVATVLGISVIEKHLTLDRNLGGEDSGFSLNLTEFKQLVEAIRNTKLALGKINYDVNPKTRLGARSLFVTKDIKKGEVFTKDNISSIRPSNGLHPKYYDEILGKKANKNLNFAHPLSLDDIDKF